MDPILDDFRQIEQSTHELHKVHTGRPEQLPTVMRTCSPLFHLTVPDCKQTKGSTLVCCSGLAVGIYTTNSPEACQYVADNCKANIIVVENHKQLQKILQVQDSLPHLKAIVQYKGALKEKRPNLYSVSQQR